MTVDTNARPCPKCGEPESDRYFDRHGIYSGRACHKCAHLLPGQGAMRDYEADEPIDGDSEGGGL